MISVDVEPSRKLVRACMTGFLSIQEVEDFSLREQGLVEAMGWKSGEFLLLVDTEGAVIQSADVVAALQATVLKSRYKAGRIAVVRHDALTRFQTERILGVRDNAEIFRSAEDALEWLLYLKPEVVARKSAG